MTPTMASASEAPAQSGNLGLMKIVTESREVFACYSKACAPPPAGTGGSSPKGSIVTARYDKDGNRTDNLPERTPMGALKHTPNPPRRVVGNEPKSTEPAGVTQARYSALTRLSKGPDRSIQFGKGDKSYQADLRPLANGYRLKLTEKGRGLPGSGPLGNTRASKTLIEEDFLTRSSAVRAIETRIA